jgi:high-affinity iron transporter
MLGALLIVFREMIEAGLIVGIVLAATKGVAGRSLWVGGGVGAGVLGACILAIFAGGLSSLGPGAVQRPDPRPRGGHAHLAQCLDGQPWP